jgi:hypothetical protein
MAIQQTPQADDFKREVRDVLQRETLNDCAINIRRHANVYASSDQNDSIYFIVRGAPGLTNMRTHRNCSAVLDCSTNPH